MKKFFKVAVGVIIIAAVLIFLFNDSIDKKSAAETLWSKISSVGKGIANFLTGIAENSVNDSGDDNGSGSESKETGEGSGDSVSEDDGGSDNDEESATDSN